MKELNFTWRKVTMQKECGSLMLCNLSLWQIHVLNHNGTSAIYNILHVSSYLVRYFQVVHNFSGGQSSTMSMAAHRPRPMRGWTAVGAMYATPGPPTVYAPNIVPTISHQECLHQILVRLHISHFIHIWNIAPKIPYHQDIDPFLSNIVWLSVNNVASKLYEYCMKILYCFAYSNLSFESLFCQGHLPKLDIVQLCETQMIRLSL